MIRVYAIFFRLPFERETLCIYDIDNVINQAENYKFTSNCEVICINFNEYIYSISNNSNIPSNIFDINVATRMVCGASKSEYNNDNAPWDGISCLGKHFVGNSYFSLIRNIQSGKFGNYADWISTLPVEWKELLINALKDEYDLLKSNLEAEGLLEQFINIEMPLMCEFSKIGVQGILIDPQKLKDKYYFLDYEYYKSVKTLEIDHGFKLEQYSDKISYNNIKEYVSELSPEDFSTKYFWDCVELLQESSPFLNALLIEHKNRWDISELLRIGSSPSDCCKLFYDIFGTVSGRVLVTRPGIQYLKKASRDIFIPQTDFKFIYADYSQFEPGILASISGDNNLLNVYNNGDVYQGLATTIGVGCSRKIAKELFLSYIYGMSKVNLKAKISRIYGVDSGTLADEFFNQFSVVENWKNRVVEETKQQKKIKGLFSYIRKVMPDDSERDIERWAPNHIIQSTASGIFKNAVLSIMKEFDYARVLIPMHDAILIECPVKLVEEMRKKIEIIMIKCFRETCSDVKARITFEEF